MRSSGTLSVISTLPLPTCLLRMLFQPTFAPTPNSAPSSAYSARGSSGYQGCQLLKRLKWLSVSYTCVIGLPSSTERSTRAWLGRNTPINRNSRTVMIAAMMNSRILYMGRDGAGGGAERPQWYPSRGRRAIRPAGRSGAPGTPGRGPGPAGRQPWAPPGRVRDGAGA